MNLEFGAYFGFGAAASRGPRQGVRRDSVRRQIPDVGGLDFLADCCVFPLFCSGPLSAEMWMQTEIKAIHCILKYFF